MHRIFYDDYICGPYGSIHTHQCLVINNSRHFWLKYDYCYCWGPSGYRDRRLLRIVRSQQHRHKGQFHTDDKRSNDHHEHSSHGLPQRDHKENDATCTWTGIWAVGHSLPPTQNQIRIPVNHTLIGGGIASGYLAGLLHATVQPKATSVYVQCKVNGTWVGVGDQPYP